MLGFAPIPLRLLRLLGWPELPPASPSEDSVVALSFDENSTGKTFADTKVRYTWEVSVDGKVHRIEFTNTKTSGKKRIFVDGRLLHEMTVFRSPNFQYSWPIGGHLLSIVPVKADGTDSIFDKASLSFASMACPSEPFASSLLEWSPSDPPCGLSLRSRRRFTSSLTASILRCAPRFRNFRAERRHHGPMALRRLLRPPDANLHLGRPLPHAVRARGAKQRGWTRQEILGKAGRGEGAMGKDMM
eukprot:g26375.t1